MPSSDPSEYTGGYKQAPLRKWLSIASPFWLNLEKATADFVTGWVAGPLNEPLGSGRVTIGEVVHTIDFDQTPGFRMRLGPVKKKATRFKIANHGQAVRRFEFKGQIWKNTRPHVELRRDENKSGAGKGLLFYFAPIDFHFRQQRSQHLARALSAHYRDVIYIGPSAVSHSRLEPMLRYRDVIADGEVTALYHGVGDPNASLLSLSGEDRRDFISTLLEIAKPHGEYDLLVQYPGWHAYIGELSPRKSVYDCIDSYSLFPGVDRRFGDWERQIIDQVDFIIGSSRVLLDDVLSERHTHRHATQIRNAASPVQMSSMADDKRKNVAIYIGAVEEWFDAYLLAVAAGAAPNVRFEIIGKVNRPMPKMPSNVHLFGELSHDAAMHRASRAKVGLIPFEVSDFTRKIDAVKLYEYLAHGLSVVSTPYNTENGPVQNAIQFAETGNLLAKHVEQLVKDWSPEIGARNRTLVESETWKERARAVVDVLEGERGEA